MRGFAISLLVLFFLIPIRGQEPPSLEELQSQNKNLKAENAELQLQNQKLTETIRQIRWQIPIPEGEDDPEIEIMRQKLVELEGETADLNREIARRDAELDHFRDSVAENSTADESSRLVSKEGMMMSEMFDREWAEDLHRRAFEAQYFESRFIFRMIVGLVSLGLLFSAYHLLWAPRSKIKKLRQGKGEDVKEASSLLRIGETRIEITSPLLGMIALGLSLGILFVYLRFVYPVSVISTG